ncbi:lysozyme [Shewanella algae]|uniref:lysozyme n=1 Tax=Shewanella algae TaxID=38313 RepID=UPI0031F592D9
MNKLRTFLIAAGLSGAAVTGGVFIVDQEDLVLGTYVDPVGIVTECAGQRADGQEPGQPRSMEYCLNQIADNLATYNRQLLRLTDGVTLTDSENAAYLSFIYNVGAEAFRTSTLRKKLLAGDHTGACNELSRWVYAKGEILPGLVKRRSAERELCLQELTNVEITERWSWQRATLRDWRFDPGLRWAWRGVVLLES